ncbi:MAG: UDP-N-acetylmuramate dehydrogenase [Elusimicrobia bacterium]|nr:UDP-N-acetylmuramate dehydrogenase [Elusimicrobiota bacterium]
MIKTPWGEQLKARLGPRCFEGAFLSLYTTYKVGGPAQVLAFPETADELRLVLNTAREAKVPLTMLGLGSNILASDGGVPGIVCCTRGMRGIERAGETITARAGSALDEVAEAAASAGLSGMEKLSGIPGSVGGAVWMNAGAFGQETFDCLIDVQVMDAAGAVKTFKKSELKPSYRKVEGLAGFLVLSARWALKAGDAAALKEIRAGILSQRAVKQPLEYPSAGSVFKRPQGDFASRLIDVCGLKGFSIGGAQVSPKHAGFIVNTGGATASDVYALIKKVIAEVKGKTGVELELEQILLGDFQDAR